MAERVFSFGPFRFIPAQQLLLDGEAPVRVGSRALEILAGLVERPGTLVTKDELMARVWPDTVVEDSNLKVNVAALRRALGESKPGRRYVATVPGRGYRFVAHVEYSGPGVPTPKPRSAEHSHNLPASWTRAIGRAQTIDALRKQLPQGQFVTIVGASGIGKTTVAHAVAEASIGAYAHGVWLVDFAPLRDPQFVASALASALGLTIPSDNAATALTAYLRDKQMLLVLNSCEHVIEAAASTAEQIISGAPGVHVLATSREPLRAKGERVHRLSPLESPPLSSGLTAAEALTYPAVQLFVARAAECLDGFEFGDADAPAVADICRKLEGIALAIELAATRIDAFGVRELSALLDDRFRLLSQHRRGALCPRHRSLAAALDWSYDLLSADERTTLRRLSVFAGAFSLQSAGAVAAGAELSVPEVIDCVANLVAKSLISADISDAVVQYRLLGTTRAYALQKLAEDGELDASMRRHAEHHRDLFARAAADWEARPAADWLADYGRRIDDVRNALSWAFSEGGDPAIGVALTVAAIPLWMHLSLLDECRICVERALASEAVAKPSGDRDRMKLYAALGAALLYAHGPLPETDAAWTAALRMAEDIGDVEYQLRVLCGLTIYRIYIGDYRAALTLAERFHGIAEENDDRAALLSAGRLIATALHYLGDQPNARLRLDAMLSRSAAPAQRPQITRFQLDQRAVTQSTMANILWLQGFPDQALRAADRSLEAALASDHVLSLCSVLVHAACPIALYVGDLPRAERALTMLSEQLAKHALPVSRQVGVCLRGLLDIKRGDFSGLPHLRIAIDEIRDAKYGLRYPAFLGVLAYGLAANGQTTEARAAIDEALNWAERTEELWVLPELLRIKGKVYRLLATPAALAAAESHFLQAREAARQQRALSWELRAATSLAGLWHRAGRTEEAFMALSSVYDQFEEGFGTLDLRTARLLLDDIRHGAARRPELHPR
ncbi:ATP-binding protein [Rhodomicrobium vannielii]|uniref:ATP-binding protein n=1 Tax=Rhodomicrobium vannielii TaxID=1069 RepID=UPI001AEC9AEB|nr:winged helix-turn-helix domain-containing protein [Rhodomicrobium vannielii]